MKDGKATTVNDGREPYTLVISDVVETASGRPLDEPLGSYRLRFADRDELHHPSAGATSYRPMWWQRARTVAARILRPAEASRHRAL